jgi:hypothetical protein
VPDTDRHASQRKGMLRAWSLSVDIPGLMQLALPDCPRRTVLFPAAFLSGTVKLVVRISRPTSVQSAQTKV